MTPILLTLLGTSWRTTLIGLGESAAIGALTYAANTEYHDPRVFWSGLGLAALAAVRGRLTKDAAVGSK